MMMMVNAMMILSIILCSLCTFVDGSKPLIITSRKFSNHHRNFYHPESPERIHECISMLNTLTDQIQITEPSAVSDQVQFDKALEVIKDVHDIDYVTDVEKRCKNNEVYLSPWDQDTYISKGTFHQTVLAQSAWLDGVNEVLNEDKFAFAITRPPGHHALRSRSMGFCIFNFAVGAAHYALRRHDVERVAMLDFDVHFGNGIASLVRKNPNIRYTSLHQDGLFPLGQGGASERGEHNNILNIPLSAQFTWKEYAPLLRERAIPFLKEFDPQLLIVSAGYDALASDSLAEGNLVPADYREMAKEIRSAFGGAVLFGLEGGYNVVDLSQAVKETITAFL